MKKIKSLKVGDKFTVRACYFDMGWEFDAPGFIYYPFFRFTYGNNSDCLQDIIEDSFIDLCIATDGGKDIPQILNEWKSEAEDEAERLGVSLAGLKKRKNAEHYEENIVVITYDDDLSFDTLSQKESYGPFEQSKKRNTADAEGDTP
jgi:hypothetical protein